MSAVLRTVGAVVLVLAATTAAADELEYFKGSELSFEGEGKPASAPVSPAPAAPSDSAVPEAPLPPVPTARAAVAAGASGIASTVGGQPLVAGDVKAKAGGGVIRAIAPPVKPMTVEQAAKAAREGSQRSAAGASPGAKPEEVAAIVEVRELSPEIRRQVEGRFRCADPLMAVVRLDDALRQKVGMLLGTEPSKLGSTLLWVFGKESNCSDGQTPAPLQKALDAGAREFLRLHGAK